MTIKLERISIFSGEWICCGVFDKVLFQNQVKRFQIHQSWSLRLNHLKMGHGKPTYIFLVNILHIACKVNVWHFLSIRYLAGYLLVYGWRGFANVLPFMPAKC